MTNILFNTKHLKEYASYGIIAGLFYVLTVWFFLYNANYLTAPALFIGCIFFMFVNMIYALKLAKRRPDYYSTWVMIIAGQMTVAVGVVVSVIGSLILCYLYLPGFANSVGVNDFLRNAAGEFSVNNPGKLELIFMTATIENYLVGAFISAMISYAVKPNQTEDQTPTIFEEPAELKNL